MCLLLSGFVSEMPPLGWPPFPRQSLQCSVFRKPTVCFSLLGRQKRMKNGLTQQSPQVLSRTSKGPNCSCGLCFWLANECWWRSIQVGVGRDPSFFFFLISDLSIIYVAYSKPGISHTFLFRCSIQSSQISGRDYYPIWMEVQKDGLVTFPQIWYKITIRPHCHG